MPRTARPVIRKLDEQACREILARNHVGRLAYGRHDQVEVEPIHYVYADGWIFGRTSPGAKTQATGPGGSPVAFEVDEAENLFRWRSVVVHGGFHVLPPTSSDDDLARLQRAVELLGTLIPETLAEGDPVPHRTVVFGITVDAVSGREAAPADTPAGAGGRQGRAAERHRGSASTIAGTDRSRPVALLGEPTALGQHIRGVLHAAGYRVLEAAAPEDLVAIARQSAPRVVIAAPDGAEAWRRLVPLMAERLSAPIPIVLVGMETLPIDGVTGVVAYAGNRAEPSFDRRILDEVQYAEQKDQAPAQLPSANPH